MSRGAYILGTLLAANLLATAWLVSQSPRIAYVRSQELVYGYSGMTEAMDEFRSKQGGMRANLDTLAADLRREIEESKQAWDRLTEEDRQVRQQLIATRQRSMAEQERAMAAKAEEMEKELLAGVLGQVNTFIENFATEKGYHVVLGTTSSGSLLYGEAGWDITDEVLAELNKEYEGR